MSSQESDDDTDTEVVIRDGQFVGASFQSQEDEATVGVKKERSIHIEQHEYHGADGTVIGSSRPIVTMGDKEEMSTSSSGSDQKTIERMEKRGIDIAESMKKWPVDLPPIEDEESASTSNQTTGGTVATTTQHPENQQLQTQAGASAASVQSIVKGGRFENTHIGTKKIVQKVKVIHDQRTQVITHHHHHDPEHPTAAATANEIFEKNVEDFLKRTKIHLRKMLGNDINYTSQPTKMILDMEGSKENGLQNVVHGNTDTLFGRDVERIELEQFHETQNDKPTRHVMILGDAGSGKTTISKMYSSAVSETDDILENIQLVHLVQASDLQSRSPSSAFDLLFTQQMAGDTETELSAEVAKAGQVWVEKNSDKILLTIDGLDQLTAPIGGRYPKINADTAERCDSVLANVMSGNIWGRAHVLTSSRWNIFWNLMAEQKPDKVIGLRGFDDENLKRATLQTTEDNVKINLIFNQLQSKYPKLFSLCRNPLFLRYTTKVFKKNANQMPDSISGLMSAVFLDFLHSPHGHTSRLYSLTKLAYQGMIDNRFSFTTRYLENLEINPEELKGFLTLKVILQSDYEIPDSHDKAFMFSHQTMQEYCCSLHIPNLEPKDVISFAATTLNERSMEMTRKLFYGTILNEETTKSMRRYLEDRKCSIDECRDILFNQLIQMTSNNTIHDIQVVTLLSECGAPTIQKFNKHVQRIRIDAEDLLQNDQITLVSMMTQLSPLEEVYVYQFLLDPPLIQQLKDGCHQIETFEAGYEVLDSVTLAHFDDAMQLLKNTKLLYVRLRCHDEMKSLFLNEWMDRSEIPFDNLGLLNITHPNTIEQLFKFLSKFSLVVLRLNILCDVSRGELSEMSSREDERLKVDILVLEDKSLTSERIAAYLAIFSQCGCSQLSLVKCNLTKEKFHALIESCRRFKIKLTQLNIWDDKMPVEAYREVSATLHTTQCGNTAFTKCNLSKEKLSEFGNGCKENECSLQCFSIIDKSMAEDGYYELANTIVSSSCRELHLEDCSLTKEKIQRLWEGCRDGDVRLHELKVFDKEMPVIVYRKVSSVLELTQCKNMVFGHCGLTKEKIFEFGKGCQDAGVTLQKLCVVDKSMNEEGYYEIANTVKSSACKEFKLQDCDLNKDKMHRLVEGCRYYNVQLTQLKIWNDKMPIEAYREVSATLHITQCGNITFGQCNLSKAKLSEFGNGCKDNEWSLTQMIIRNDKMPVEAYREVSATLHTTQCRNIAFDECNLSNEKLSEFGNGCKDNKWSLQLLIIVDQSMNVDGYYELANTVKSSACKQLQLEDCELNKDKMHCLVEGCRYYNVQLTQLNIVNDTMPAEAFPQVSETLHASQCGNITFVGCNLTKEKLSEFGKGCKDKECSLQFLNIIDKSMNEEGYYELAKTVKSSSCKELQLQDCELNKEKMHCLVEGCRYYNVQIPRVNITDKSMGKNAYQELAGALKSSLCKTLQLRDCDLTKEKVKRLSEGCERQQVQLSCIVIADSTMPPAAFRQLALLLSAAKCWELWLGFCKLSGQKLFDFINGCVETDTTIAELIIVDEGFSATEDLIIAVCELMTNVVEDLDIQGWIVDEHGRQLWKTILHDPNSKVRSLKLPDEEYIHKQLTDVRPSAEEPSTSQGCSSSDEPADISTPSRKPKKTKLAEKCIVS